MDIDITHIALIAQTAGSFAVVITLIFIGVQIRQNTKQNRISTVRNLVGQFGDSYFKISSDASFADIWVRGLKNYNKLKIVERARFSAFCAQYTQIMSELLILKNLSEIKKDTWNAYEKSFAMVFSNKGMQQWVESRKDLMTKDFREYVLKKIDVSKQGSMYNEQ